MRLPKLILVSDLLNHNVRCDLGLEHGPGVSVWMYPPVHRILGLISRPSNFRLTREVWRLNQLKAIGSNELFVKGVPASSDQAMVERFPTLMNAHIINANGERIGLIADFAFNPMSGKIIYYLAARSNPKIPGSSRWKLSISLIVDQQPGSVFCNCYSLDDFPIYKSSIKQDFLSKSRKWRSQIQDISLKASDRLEGWLDDQSWEEKMDIHNHESEEDNYQNDLFNDWTEEEEVDRFQKSNRIPNNNETDSFFYKEKDSDPWI